MDVIAHVYECYNLTGYNQFTWLGATDEAIEGTWVWQYSRQVAVPNWMENEPNNHGDDGEQCSALFTNGKWVDFSCDGSLPFICEITNISGIYIFDC